MCAVCDLHANFLSLKVAILFAFFGLLRISNLAPAPAAGFDADKDTLIDDIRVHENSLVIYLKWTKTLQDSNQEAHIVVPALNDKDICPVKAFIDLTEHYNKYAIEGEVPLLPNPCAGQSKFMSTHMLRKWLNLAQDIADLDIHLTFHAFRRGGASLLYAEFP